MTAYVLANVEAHNTEAYQEYVRRNTELVQQYGGRFIARGGAVEVLEGDWALKRLVVIEFPSVEAARTWYHSPEYQAIVPIRRGNAHTHLLAIVEGVQ